MAGSLVERRSSELSDRDWYIQETFGFDRCDACKAIPIEVRASILVPKEIVAKRNPIGVQLGLYGEPVRMRRSTEPYLMVKVHRACVLCRKSLFQVLMSAYPDSAVAILEEPPTNRIVVACG